MIKRVWFPGLCALIVVGAVYWFFVRPEVPPIVLSKPLGEQYAPKDMTAGVAASMEGSSVQGPQMPAGANQNINQSSDNQKIMGATFHTNMGDFTVAFNPNTPKTVENFVKLAKSGFYDNTKFHRVIAGFMNQGGDPLSKDDKMMARWGTGGPGYQFADEIKDDNNNAPGTLSMANAGPNTNGSQFFINVADNSFLNDKHTVFGAVTEGAEVVMAINGVKTGEADRPLEPVIIKSITLK
jgi:cyclophilin family peptidyl-prolyl cis-trans isomerase